MSSVFLLPKDLVFYGNSIELFNDESIKRVAHFAEAVLPLAALYEPFGRAVFQGMSFFRSGVSCIQCKEAIESLWKEEEIFASSSQLIFTAIIVSSLFMNTPVGLLLTSGQDAVISIGISMRQLFSASQKENKEQIAYQLLVLSHDLLYIALFFYCTKELLVCSYLIQAVLGVIKAWEEYQGGYWVECTARLILALAKSMLLYETAHSIYRNQFGKTLTQEEFDIFVASYKKEENLNNVQDTMFKKLWKSFSLRNKEVEEATLNLTEFLVQGNYKDCIKGISLSGVDEVCIVASRVHFLFCDFQDIVVHDSVFEYVLIEECDLDYTLFTKSRFSHVVFSDCSLKESSFLDVSMDQVSFLKSQLFAALFYDSNLDRVVFKVCNLMESCFLGSQAQALVLQECQADNALFFNTQEGLFLDEKTSYQMTKPVVGLLLDIKGAAPFASLMRNWCKTQEVSVLPIPVQPNYADPALLEEEVLGLLSKMLQEGERGPIPQELLRNAEIDSMIFRIQQKSKEVLQSCDFLILPGGSDIEPALYGKEQEPHTYTEQNFIRSIIEISLIQEAKDKQIPTLGICRGAQMINVFCGGTLKQHVPGHFGVFHQMQIVEGHETDAAMIFREIFQERGILGLSMHRQAIDEVGSDLEVILEVDSVPKALVSQDRNFFLTQFHPEIAIEFSDEELKKEEMLFQDSKGALAKIAAFRSNGAFLKYLFSLAEEHFIIASRSVKSSLKRSFLTVLKIDEELKEKLGQDSMMHLQALEKMKLYCDTFFPHVLQKGGLERNLPQDKDNLPRRA